MKVEEVVELFERERDAIWLEQPEEIRILSRGEHPRGIGSRGQYLTPIMFAEGAARNLADEVLWSIIGFCDRPELDFATLKVMAAEMAGRKAGFFELFGLEHVSRMVTIYARAVDGTRDRDELKRLSLAMSAYVNRVHVWLDAAFPWGVCSGYMRAGHGRRNAEGREE